MTSVTAEPFRATVLVTGASRGLGAAMAEALAAKGYRVIAAMRRPSDAALSTGTRVVPLDVEDPRSIEALAATLAGESIDILVNNAAIRGDTGGLSTLEPEDFLAVMRVNALAPLLLARALHPNLKAGRLKKIINISSRSGSLAEGTLDDDEGDYAYRCSKAALNMAGVKLAQDFRRDGITVLALHPGWVKTDMGGAEAPLDLQESVTGLIARIEEAGLHQTGHFLRFDGRPIAW